MKALLLFLGFLALPQPVASAPRITHITNPSLPGRLTVICGGLWEEAKPSLAAVILPDDPAGLPTKDIPQLPTSESREVKVVQQSHGVLTCLMPEGPFGVVAVWGRNSAGRGEPVLVNRPEADWAYPQFPIPGHAFRILGRNLVGLELYPESSSRPVSYGGYVKSATRVVLRAPDGVCRQAVVEKASAYDVHCRLPLDIPPGKHQVYVHNGHGGPPGWSSALEIEIRRSSPWPTTTFDSRKYGVVADGNADDAGAIQAALDAAGKGGGGVVLLPRGTYLIGRTLRMPRKTVLRGETRDRTWLFTPSGIFGGYGRREDGLKIPVVIGGEGEFGLEDLSIQTVYSPQVVAAPIVKSTLPLERWGQQMDFHHTADDVFIRRCRILQQPNFAHAHRPDYPDLAGKKLADARDYEPLSAVGLCGERNEVVDCEIRGGGKPITMWRPMYCRVAGCLLRTGSGGSPITWVGFSGHRMGFSICEDNRMTADTAESVHGMVTGPGARFLYIARNDIQTGWQGDSESILIHVGGGKFSCRVASADGTKLSLDPAEAALTTKIERHGHSPWPVVETDGRLKPHAMRDVDFDSARRPLEGGDCTIVSGPGIGQVRRILDNDAQSVQLDRPWSIAPTRQSRVLLCQYELYHRLLIVDNVIGESGNGVNLWGNSYDTIVDGNRTARTIGASVFGMTHYDPRCMDIGYFNQVLHNTCSAGRFRAPEQAGQAMRGWIGAMTYNFGLPGWAGHLIVGPVFRGNLCEDDSRFLLTTAQYQAGQPPHILGAILEDNRTAHSRAAVQIGPGVRAVLRNNHEEDVETRYSGEGMNDCVVLEPAKP